MPPRELPLHVQLRLPSLSLSRVSRIFRDAVVLRPEFQRIIDTCEAIGTNRTQYRTTSSRSTGSRRNVSPSLARFKISWEGFVASRERVEDAGRVISVASFVSLFCARSSVTVWQSYPDCISDPGRGERSVDSHKCSLIRSLSFGIVYIVRFDNVRSMSRVSRRAEVHPTLHTLT